MAFRSNALLEIARPFPQATRYLVARATYRREDVGGARIVRSVLRSTNSKCFSGARTRFAALVAWRLCVWWLPGWRTRGCRTQSYRPRSYRSQGCRTFVPDFGHQLLAGGTRWRRTPRHYVELYRNDRWRRYYSEEEFPRQMTRGDRRGRRVGQGARLARSGPDHRAAELICSRAFAGTTPSSKTPSTSRNKTLGRLENRLCRQEELIGGCGPGGPAAPGRWLAAR